MIGFSISGKRTPQRTAEALPLSTLSASDKLAGETSLSSVPLFSSPHRIGSPDVGVGRAMNVSPKGLHRAATFIGDLIGVAALFVLLFGSLFLAGAM